MSVFAVFVLGFSRTYILKHNEFVHYINMSLCWLRKLFIRIKFVRYV